MAKDLTKAKSIREQVRHFPAGPGVYIMRDHSGKAIYVGKAKNLRSRVRSYFTGDRDVKTRHLVGKIATIDYLVTSNEYEALLLENNLIKEHHPRYNINLKDGKSYPVIRITNDEYPRVFRTRRIIQDGSLYYGPYTNVTHLETYLELIDKLFPLRKCKRPELRPREHPCLYYHIGRCAAVCAGKTGKEEYLHRIEQIKRLLSGKTDSLVAEIEERMAEASRQLQFERAAEYRDAIEAIETIEAEQRIVDFDPDVRDYIGYAAKEELCSFVIFQMRSGKLIGSNVFHSELFGTDEENLSQFLVQYYSSVKAFPAKLFTHREFADSEQLRTFFKDEMEADVRIMTPETKRDASILRMTFENARQDLEKRIRQRGNLPALQELQKVLRLKRTPLRIEGFDIAQVGGKHPVASMVSFANGVPDKAQYRKFHIRNLKGEVDDYEAMREAMARRYTRVVNEKLPKPDLILVDGGKGQVSAAKGILDSLGLESIPLVGLAKKHEELFVPENPDPLRLPEGSPPLRVLQHVRDEAHRFATTFRAGLQSKEISRSTLEEVSGIGPKRAARLLKAFQSVEAILETPPDIIAKSTGISEEKATELQNHLKRADEGAPS
ncbi:MAG: excinuclease ABC subunit UvrC [Alkalispirochaetaceae bacterium]